MRLVMANSGHQTVPKKRYDAVVRRFVYDLRGPPGLDDEAVPGRDPMTGELLHHAQRKLLRYTVDDAHLSPPHEETRTGPDKISERHAFRQRGVLYVTRGAQLE